MFKLIRKDMRVMKKKGKIASISIIAVVLVGIIVLIVISSGDGGVIGGFQASSVQVDVIYKDGSSKIATGFDFRYDNVKRESVSVVAELSSDSAFKITSFNADSECKIIVYDNDVQVWSSAIKEDGFYTDIVNADGIYSISLVMETGEGEGCVNISKAVGS